MALISECGKACEKANIYKVINFICTYISDGLLYLYEFFNSYSLSFIRRL